jgi:hypothetical protein
MKHMGRHTCDNVFFIIQLNFVTSLKEEFEDVKGVIIICNSKDRQHNGQKIKDKMTNNDLHLTYT